MGEEKREKTKKDRNRAPPLAIKDIQSSETLPVVQARTTKLALVETGASGPGKTLEGTIVSLV